MNGSVLARKRATVASIAVVACTFVRVTLSKLQQSQAIEHTMNAGSKANGSRLWMGALYQVASTLQQHRDIVGVVGRSDLR